MSEQELYELVTRMSHMMQSGGSNGHGGRVSVFAVAIGGEIDGSDKLDPTRLKHLEYSAMLHDFAKPFMNLDIFNKRGALTSDERLYMQGHCNLGYQIVESILPSEISRTLKFHHERWDGSGYPEKRVGLDIPQFPRIVAIADVWDALTSERPYRKAYKPEIAIGVMNEMQGGFDPDLYAIFLRLLREHKLNGQ